MPSAAKTGFTALQGQGSWGVREHQRRRDQLYYGHGADQRHRTGRWLRKCSQMLDARKQQETRRLHGLELVACGFFVRSMFRHWRGKVLRRRAVRAVLKGAVLRWAFARWRLIAVVVRLGAIVEAGMTSCAVSRWRQLCAEQTVVEHYQLKVKQKALRAIKALCMHRALQSDTAAKHHGEVLSATVLRSWRCFRSGMVALRLCGVKHEDRCRRSLLGGAIRQWAHMAAQMQVTAVWTGTSLHRALLVGLKRQALIVWYQNVRVSRASRRILRVAARGRLRSAFAALRSGHHVARFSGTPPPRPAPEMHPVTVIGPKGRPRRNVCRCVYDVLRTKRCHCTYAEHLRRRLESCEDILEHHYRRARPRVAGIEP